MGVKLNRSDLAAHMGVSVVTIDTWRKEGMPYLEAGVRGKAWSFDLAEVIKWKIEKSIKAAVGTDETTDLAAIEKRTASAKMQMAELALAKERGDVAPVREFERAQAKAFAEVRANIMNVPQRVVIQLLGETDETVFKAKLRAELTLALQAAAEADLTLDEDEDDDAEE